MESAPGRILIVDDEPPLLKMMGLYLTRVGFEVVTTDTTDKAWALAEAEPKAFAAAVLDGSMLGMTMEDLALRLLRNNPEMSIVAASGYLVDLSVLSAEAPGRVTFLQKPFSPEMLATTLRRMLASQKEKDI